MQMHAALFLFNFAVLATANSDRMRKLMGHPRALGFKIPHVVNIGFANHWNLFGNPDAFGPQCVGFSRVVAQQSYLRHSKIILILDAGSVLSN